MLIIHVADIHLGASPDVGEPWGEKRKQEIWDSFERLIDSVEEQGADLLLIAGDLFHRPPLLRELREVNELFGTLSKTKVVLIAGNHDFIGENSFYRKFQWAENVIFLGEKDITSVKIPELKTEVYGLSYHSRERKERLYDSLRPDENGYYHILLAHGGDEKHIPFTKESLARSGFDYIAFGHIHKPGMILADRAVMAGSLEPTDYTCVGKHGYIRVEVNHGKNEVTLVNFASREYLCLELMLTPEDTMISMIRRLEEVIEKRGKSNIYEIVLTGECHESLEISKERLKVLGNIREITDRTKKAYDYQSLKDKFHGRILQKYIESFENDVRYDGARGIEMRDPEVEKRALELGTEAILEAMKL